MIRAALMVCLLPGAAAAQDYDAMDRAQCEALLGRVDMLQLGTPVGAKVGLPSGGYCRYRDVRIGGAANDLEYRLDTVWLRIAGAGRLEHGLPPEAVDLRIEGAHFAYALGDDEVTAWLLGEQSRADGGITLVLCAHWDRAGKRLVVEEASADFPWDNTARISGVIENVDLTDAVAMRQSLFEAGVARVELELVSNGLFEQLLLLPLGHLLLEPGSDPAEQVKRWKADAARILGAIPPTTLPPSARDALLALIGDMPHPRGRVAVTGKASPAYGLGRLAAVAMAGAPVSVLDVMTLVDGVAVTAEYAPGDR